MIYISRMNERGSEQNMWRETCKTGVCTSQGDNKIYFYRFLYHKDFFIKY